MHTEIFLIGLLIFSAHLFTSLFTKTKIPDVLLLMIVGILCGPVFHFASPDDFGKLGTIITTIALIVILFDGGSHISISALKSTFKDTIKLSLLTYIFSVGITIVAVHYYSNVGWLIASIIGFILGAVSPAVVLPMIQALGFKTKSKTILMLETAITDVLTIIIVFNLFTASQTGNVSGVEIFKNIILSFVIASVIGVVGGLFWSALLTKIRQFPNTIFTTFAFVFILFGFAEFFHFSGAITSLAFGFTLSNLDLFKLEKFDLLAKINFNEILAKEHSFFQEIMFLLKIFFFVYLGISFPLNNYEVLIYGLVLSIILFGIRFIITRLTIPTSINIRESVIISIMIPKGLASAVLASVALQMSLDFGELIQTLVYSVILWTILISAILVSLLEKTSLKKSFAHLLGMKERYIEESLQEEDLITSMKSEVAESGDNNA